MRTAARCLLGLCLTGGAVLGPALPSLAAESGTTTVKPSAEAWYRATPACLLPTGCAGPATAPSPYSADTLHVGVNAGAEEARTYLQLDLTALPSGTKPAGGTLLLPVAGGNAGTRSPESAKLQVCAVKAEVKDADGSFAAPLEPDCKSGTAPATFVPAAGDRPAAFTVDLAALSAAWDGAAAPGALALLPAAGTAPTASWHVAFSDRSRTGAGVVPISAALAFVSASLATDSDQSEEFASPSFASAPAFQAPAGSFASEAGTSLAAPALSAQMPLLPAPAAQAAPAPVAAAPAPQQVVPVASFMPSGFRYPAVFLLPLLLAVGAAWVGRALTQDLTSARA